jgi:hypothetical protein
MSVTDLTVSSMPSMKMGVTNKPPLPQHKSIISNPAPLTFPAIGYHTKFLDSSKQTRKRKQNQNQNKETKPKSRCVPS